MQRFFRLFLPIILGILCMTTNLTVTHAVNVQDVIPTPPQVFQDINNPEFTTELRGDNSGVNRNLINEGPKRILDILFGAFTTIGTIICVIAGIRIIFSNGDAKKVQEGVKAIVYAVVGIMIIGGAWMIIRAILSINPGT